MNNPERFVATAVALMIAFLAGAYLADPGSRLPSHEPEAHSEREAASDYSKASQTLDSDQPERDDHPASPVTIVDAIHTLVSQLDSEKSRQKRHASEQREIDNLNAQNDVARWTMLMFWSSVVMALITSIGLYMLYRTLRETKRAADHADTMASQSILATEAAQSSVRQAQQIGEAQIRAYLTIQRVFSSHNEAQFVAEFTLRNVGVTPADRIKITVNYLYADGRVKPVSKEIRSLAPQESEEVEIEWADFIQTRNARDTVMRIARPQTSGEPPANELTGTLSFTDVFVQNPDRDVRSIEFRYIGDEGEMRAEYKPHGQN